jgi:hypothetical protein
LLREQQQKMRHTAAAASQLLVTPAAAVAAEMTAGAAAHLHQCTAAAAAVLAVDQQWMCHRHPCPLCQHQQQQQLHHQHLLFAAAAAVQVMSAHPLPSPLLAAATRCLLLQHQPCQACLSQHHTHAAAAAAAAPAPAAADCLRQVLHPCQHAAAPAAAAVLLDAAGHSMLQHQQHLACLSQELSRTPLPLCVAPAAAAASWPFDCSYPAAGCQQQQEQQQLMSEAAPPAPVLQEKQHDEHPLLPSCPLQHHMQG